MNKHEALSKINNCNARYNYKNSKGILSLRNFGIKDSDVDFLCKKLNFCQNITILDLSHNFLTIKGAKYLAENLTHVRELRLSFNNLLKEEVLSIKNSYKFKANSANLIYLYRNKDEKKKSPSAIVHKNLEYDNANKIDITSENYSQDEISEVYLGYKCKNIRIFPYHNHK